MVMQSNAQEFNNPKVKFTKTRSFWDINGHLFVAGAGRVYLEAGSRLQRQTTCPIFLPYTSGIDSLVVFTGFCEGLKKGKAGLSYSIHIDNC